MMRILAISILFWFIISEFIVRSTSWWRRRCHSLVLRENALKDYHKRSVISLNAQDFQWIKAIKTVSFDSFAESKDLVQFEVLLTKSEKTLPLLLTHIGIWSELFIICWYWVFSEAERLGKSVVNLSSAFTPPLNKILLSESFKSDWIKMIEEVWLWKLSLKLIRI